MICTPAEAEEFLTFTEIATRLKVTPGSVWRWVTQGVRAGGAIQKLSAFKAGGSWRVHTDALDDFLRRLNPDTWRRVALEQEKERRQARQDRERLQRALGGERKRKGGGHAR
jgi:helix-turn-helix protein